MSNGLADLRFRLVPLFVGAIVVLAAVYDRLTTGRPTDYALISAGLGSMGLGLGLGSEWYRRRNGKNNATKS